MHLLTNSPIFVKEADHACAGLLRVTILVDQACFGDLSCIVFPAYGIHPPKASPLLIALHFSQALPPIFRNDAFGIIIIGIFTDFLEFLGREIVEEII